MGVPKFFRYMSERYPCLSESVKEYQIPMFDNLYLDMNGIIHMCSHPDDNNPHFRITEEKLFSDIFHYIEVLFQMIKPQKVFFMAVDGVAPRAKMNQQRGRRFRSAKDAEKMEAEAIKKGEKLPEVSRFDSNCITPGTEFMAKLHEQLKYFVVKKVSTEKAWQKCKIILSGHETPGEGEHKIMDYIRYSRSQPGYDPNTRHCLYGLDADLIMLGLCTHEPHFSLLREEVKFGRKSTKRNNVPEEIRFYLLHLSLMREYLELEFSPLKSKLKDHATIKFDIEKIIDDWVLMGFLVGNDFIPHLPNLHINEDALPKLYKAYMEVLPQLDGYINEAGSLNLQRFEILVRQLSSMDLEHFEECKEDLMYMEAKTGRKAVAHVPVSTNPDKGLDEEIGALDIKGDDEFLEALSSSEVEESSDDDDDDQDEFKSFKDEYYRNKLEYQKVTKEVMRDQAEGYVRAIQWNLNYYYNGCCSWSWYYPHHYAPYVSDVRNFSNLDIKFDLGEPFKPFEQLLAVLPAASKQLLPKPYHALMTDEESKLKKYYPTEFQTDLNGKKQDWEAVVLVPFIDENILLDAMKTANDQLTQEEKDRNTHGPMLIYEYTRDDLGVYEAPAYFPSVENHAQCTPIHIKDIRVPEDKLIKGAYPGARFDVFYPGFPTMKHLNYKGELRKAKVKVFEYPSRNENMILTTIPPSDLDNENLPIDLLGRHVFVGWPHLVEAKVIAVSNKNFKCTLSSTDMKHVEKVQNNEAVFASEVEGITDKYFKSMGVDFGKITTLVHVRTMVGRRYVFTANGRVSLDKQFNPIPSAFPVQGIVKDIKVHDDYHSTFREITEVFTPGSVCFTLSNPHYGSMGKILDSSETLRNGRLKVELTILKEPDLTEVQNANAHLSRDYYDLYAATNHVAISSYVFSRITGSLYVKAPNVGDPKMINLGLDLKFNKRNQETPGYTKNIDGKWMYSMKAIELVKTYIEKFPELFFYLSRNIDHKQELHAYAIFDGEAEQKIKEIQTWLKSLPTHSMERRNCDSSVLDNDTIAQIEKIVEEFTAQPQNPRTMVLQLRPQLLYKPELQIGNLVPDPFTKTQVFDRIVNVRDSYVVPLGLKGTVVAVQKLSTSKTTDNDEVYDVVFDEPFNGGLAAACKKSREFRLSRNSLINLSHGLRGMEERTGRPGARLAQARATLGQPGTNGQNILPTMFPSFAADNNRTPRPQQQQHYPQQAFAQRHTTQQQSQSNSAFVPVAAATPPVFQVNPVVNSNRLESIPANQNFPTRPSIGNTQQQRQQQQQQQPIVRSIVPTQKTSPSSTTTTGSSLNAAASFLASGNKQSPPSGVPSKARKENSASNFALPQQANIDTDFLKRLLKINNDENRLIDNSTAPQSPRRTIDTTSELKYPKQATRDMSQQQQQQQQQQPTTTSATAQLLNYYQLNNLGLPRYNYMNTSPNYYASQIVLPDKKVIIGEQARTRAEASENVASKALEVLKANEAVGQAVPVFPEPPEKWVVGQNWQASQQSSSSGRSPQKHPSPDGSRNRNFSAQNPHHPSNVVLGSTSTAAAATTNSFVPLQAVIKHSNKKQHQQQQSHQHSTTHQQQQQQQDTRPTLAGSGDSSSSNAQPKTDVPGSDSKDHSAPSEKQTTKSRQRKTRIAANFGSRQS